MLATKLDHVVIHITDWERSNQFYQNVVGAELVAMGSAFVYRFGEVQLNVHGPGTAPTPLARIPVAPGGSDLCFEWTGTVEEAIQRLNSHQVSIEVGPVKRIGVKGPGTSVYFRDPDDSLVEFIIYDQT
jgi:catechol 2,3-dioxygenase-like lactoylglutathione lyase family enzyme